MIMKPVQYAHQHQVDLPRQAPSERPLEIRSVTGQPRSDQYIQTQRKGTTAEQGSAALLDQKALETNLKNIVQGIQALGQAQPEAAQMLQEAVLEIGQAVLRADSHPGGLPAVQRQLMPKVERLREVMEGADNPALAQLASQQPQALLTAIAVLVRQMSDTRSQEVVRLA